MLKAIILLFCLFNYLECSIINENGVPTVTLSYGTIQGIQDTNATMFLGVPYAAPPVKNLRWKDPIDVSPWKPNTLYATDYKPACPQKNCNPVSACPNIVRKNAPI